MKVINFNEVKSTVGKNMKRMIYEELIKKLEAKPAKDYVVKEAEVLADKVLEIGGYTGKSGRIPIIRIAKDFEFVTYKAKNMPDTISGNIFVDGSTRNDYDNDKVIIVGADEPLAHQRFIIAHELAHYLLGYIGSDNYKKSDYTFSKTYPKVNHNSMEEIRADRFAAELLMPRKVFLAEYLKALKNSDFSKGYVITYLAELFKVKESCVRRRIEEVSEYVEG